MDEYDFRKKLPQTDLYDEVGVGAGDPRGLPGGPPVFSGAVQWGLASLLIGCTLLVAGCVTLVFNVLLFRGGPAGIPVGPAFAGGLIGSLAVTALGVASVTFGVWGCQHAYAARSSPALGVAGLGASLAGVVAWLIAAIDLMLILFSFT